MLPELRRPFPRENNKQSSSPPPTTRTKPQKEGPPFPHFCLVDLGLAESKINKCLFYLQALLQSRHRPASKEDLREVLDYFLDSMRNNNNHITPKYLFFLLFIEPVFFERNFVFLKLIFVLFKNVFFLLLTSNLGLATLIEKYSKKFLVIPESAYLPPPPSSFYDGWGGMKSFSFFSCSY